MLHSSGTLVWGVSQLKIFQTMNAQQTKLRNSMKRSIFIRSLLLMVLLAGSVTACQRIDRVIDEIKNTREQTLFSIDEAITSIQNAPANWEQTLSRLESQLADDLQETIREDVQLLINRSVGASTTGVVCVMDAVPGRVIHSLESLRSKLLGGELTALPPTICITSHNVINLNQDKVKRMEVIYYGYDFDNRSGFSVYLLGNNNTKISMQTHMAFQSDYQFTIDLSTFSDIDMEAYKSLVVEYQGTELSRIIIQQKTVPPPLTQTVYITPNSFSYMPPHVRGDREFDGNGPNVRVSTYIYRNSRQAYMRVYMRAEETKSDWTTASGTSDRFYFYTAPNGWHIKEILGVTSFPGIVEYLDEDISDDIFNTTLGQYTVVGDSQGDDAGTSTQVSINFAYKVPIVIEED